MDFFPTRRRFLVESSRCLLALASAGPAFVILSRRKAEGFQGPTKGRLGRKESPYYERLDSGDVRCTLCPRRCQVAPGDRGYCEVRENVSGKYYSLVYGSPCAVHVDPIEKKPFFHVLPTSRSFSVATAGCNFDCKFCQNWEISQARPDETYNFQLLPDEAARLAKKYGCLSIASTYVEPTIFMEYMQDIGRAAKAAGLLNVMHSNGFVNPKPLEDLAPHLDAACIDLKGIDPEYYREMTEGELQPVLDTLKRLRSLAIHIEIVNLVLPGKNDRHEDIVELCRWITRELGRNVPVHFTRFFPRYRLKGLPPTPITTLEKAWRTAKHEGLHFAYIGNVPGHRAENTYCPSCGSMVIRRYGYQVKLTALRKGRCTKCDTPIPGIWNLSPLSSNSQRHTEDHQTVQTKG